MAMRIIKLEEVDSTNEFCKRENCKDDVLVIAKRQIGGRGTKGRSFESFDGGLYVSVMRHPKNFKAENAFQILIDGCVAVCKTLEYFDITPAIRWSNDVLVDGKKICGTLIENSCSNGYITRSIVGSGINVNNILSETLSDIAVSMRQIKGKNYDIDEVLNVYISNLEKHFALSDYKRYINWLGKNVILKTSDKQKIVLAVDIAADGRLIVEDGGKILKISSAEVSLRF